VDDGVLPTGFLRGRSYWFAKKIRTGVRYQREGRLMGQIQLVRIDVKGLPVEELTLNKVQVDRVKVICKIHNLPNLDGAYPGGLRDRICPSQVTKSQHAGSMGPLKYIQKSSPGVF